MSAVKNRTFAYEIFGYLDKRWVIDCVLPEEEAAIAQAGALLKSRYEEVRVVRHRTGSNGLTVETEIYHQARSASKAIALAGDPENVPLCKDLRSVYGLDSRLALGRLLRRYLEHECITATELMHVWPYLRRLDDQTGHLLAAAVHRVGTVQAKILGIKTIERVAALQLWLGKVMSRARDFGEVRRTISFDPANPNAAMAELERSYPNEEDRRYALTAVISYHLMGTGTLNGRLEQLFEFAAVGGPPLYQEIVCQMIADGLAFPDIVAEMVASAPNRAGMIMRIADAVTGRHKLKPGELVDPIFAGFVKLHTDLNLQDSAAVLTDWMVREVGRDKPFDHRSPADDEALLEMLLPHLRDEQGKLLGGIKMQEAIAASRLNQRQRVLRGMGMDDQANELAKFWSVEMVEGFAPLVA